MKKKLGKINVKKKSMYVSGRVALNHSFIAVAAAFVATVAALTFLVRRIHQFFSPE